MSPSDVANVFAVLLILGAAGLCGLAANRSTRTALTDAALAVGALVATGATTGSLYFSERAGFVPCDLCWHQRIAMYPLAVLLTIAAVRRDHTVRPYAMALAGLGLMVSLYQMQLQWFPDQGSTCDPTNPCSGKWVEALGFMTIPQMAGISFAMILSVLALAHRHDANDADHAEPVLGPAA